ncbi:MAG: class II D-tagatose-bisphosphate aldolase, non-catalytic subunit [Granulosicoccus sp.]
MVDIFSLIENNREGNAVGLPCFCTANEQVIRAVLKYGQKHQAPVVVEATCNQVNQDGGYTGMKPADFSAWIKTLAKEYDVSQSNIILGGDHLGPNPWRHLNTSEAMEKAKDLVRDYAAAGFRKIHLDASMACGNEPTPSFAQVAERAASLCKVAITHSPHPEELVYVIGTEVPIPGGETDDMAGITVTTVDRLNETIDTHRTAFANEGLDHVWDKIVSVVTQPGVDFSHTAVRRFDPAEAEELSNAVKNIPRMTFEAHSTDYQPTEALHELVERHFFFLKVGPELTFRMREAVFALSLIEQQLVDLDKQSTVMQVLDQAMEENPNHWNQYYQGDPAAVERLKHFSYSDRIRYYWAIPQVQKALNSLCSMINATEVPETIISQYFPARQFGSLSTTAELLIQEHVELCIERYYNACGYRS